MSAGIEHEHAQQRLFSVAIDLLSAVGAEHASTDDHHIERRPAVSQDFVPGAEVVSGDQVQAERRGLALQRDHLSRWLGSVEEDWSA
jgi:hypothetical protein